MALDLIKNLMQKLHIFIANIPNAIFSDHSKCRKKYTEEFKGQMIQCHNNRMSSSSIEKTFNISPNIVLYWIKKKNTLLPIESLIKASTPYYTYECIVGGFILKL